MATGRSNGKQRVRLGLIGAGGFGTYTTELLDRQPEIELVGVADVNLEAAERLGKARDIPYWATHNQLLEDCECDAVAVVTTHATHRDIVVDSAYAGRHVFCEKTMAITVADCYDMGQAAEANNIKLMVGHKRRFRPAAIELKRALVDGELGKPLAVNVQGFFGRRITGFWSRRADCGGLLYWAGVHDIDTLRHLFGEVSSVYAVIGPKVHPEVSDQEDAISVILTFQSGLVGSLQVSTYYPMASYQTAFGFEISCERGGVSYDSKNLTIIRQSEGGKPQQIQLENNAADTAYDHEWASFAGWILRDEPPVLTGNDGLRCVEILQAAYISADTGLPVKLPLDTNERRPHG